MGASDLRRSPLVRHAPPDWNVLTVRQIATEVNERAGTRTDLPLLSVTKHRGILPAATYFGREVNGRDLAGYKVVRSGQFAYATIHLDEGAIGIQRAVPEGLVSPMYTVFASSGVVPEFLLELLRTPQYLKGYAAYSQGSVNRRLSLSFDALSGVPVAVPPATEQAAIAQFIGVIDACIGRTEELIGKIRMQKRAVMARLLVGDSGSHRTWKVLPERWVFGRVCENVLHVPADWDLLRLTSVAKLESGHTPSRRHPEYWGGPHPWLSLADSAELRNLVVRQTLETITDEGLANSSARILPAGTVILSRTAVLGQCAVLGQPTATSQDFVGFVCGPRLEPRYLCQAFRHMGREWERLKAGSSPTNKTLYYSIFQAMQILLPPIEEQRHIAQVGDAFDIRIEAERAYLEGLRQIKRGLAEALLSGRLRLPPHVVTAEGLPDVRE